MTKPRRGFFCPVLILILVAGCFLRLAFLGRFPEGLNNHEALLGYRGKLLARQIDETARQTPLFFTSFEGYQLPFSSYLVSFSQKLFGDKEFSVRLPFAFFDCIGLVLFLLFLNNFVKDKKIIVFSFLAYSINFWQIWLSRISSEYSLIYNFFLSVGILILFFSKLRKKILFKIFLGLFVVFVATLGFFYFKLPESGTILKNNFFGFFNDHSWLNGINQIRGEDLNLGRQLIGKIFYNKTFLFLLLVKKLFSFLNPRLFFAQGSGNSLHTLSNFGLFISVFIFPFFIGLYLILKKNIWKKFVTIIKPAKVFLFSFLILGILFSLFDSEFFNQEKMIFILPFFSVTIGIGLSKFKTKFLCIFLMLMIFNFAFVLYDATLKEPNRSRNVFGSSDRQLGILLKLESENFEAIYVSDQNNPDIGTKIAYYFDYQKPLLVFGPRVWLNSLKNIVIGQNDKWKVLIDKKYLFVVPPRSFGSLQTLLRTDFKKNPCYVLKNEIKGFGGKTDYLVLTNDSGCFSVENKDEKL